MRPAEPNAPASAVVVACEVMKEELTSLAGSRADRFRFVSMGLHRWPARLKEELARLIAEDLPDGCTALILGFGLCGGALNGLKAPVVPLVVPRSHDCIPLLFGSHEEYLRELTKERGTFFLSGGWLEGERTLLSEYRRVESRHGEAKARRVMAAMLDSYRRLLFITTGHPRQDALLLDARRLAELLDLPLTVSSGSDLWLERLLNGPWDRERFLVIEPGGEIGEELFSAPAAPLQAIAV